MPDRTWRGAWHEQAGANRSRRCRVSGVFVDMRQAGVCVFVFGLPMPPGAGIGFVFARFAVWQWLCPRPDVRCGWQVADAVE